MAIYLVLPSMILLVMYPDSELHETGSPIEDYPR